MLTLDVLLPEATVLAPEAVVVGAVEVLPPSAGALAVGFPALFPLFVDGAGQHLG